MVRSGTRALPWIAGGLLLATLSLGLLGTGFEYDPVSPRPAGSAPPAWGTGGDAGPRDSTLRSLRRSAPRGRYIVIDRTHNRLYLRDGSRVLLSAVCSSGSGVVFSAGDRRWVFDTPRGRFRVERMQADPVWKKPDWAFLEEGKPVPADPRERFDYEMLGEYALYFGDGYMIHGTLYERLLGRSVTHGCIRLGRDDLRNLYGAVDEGTPIYIF